MGYSEHLPSGRWRGVAKVADASGKVRRVGCGTHDTEWEADLAWQERERGKDTQPAVLTVSRYADEWADRKRGGWAASTRSTNGSVVRFLRTDPLGRLDVTAVTRADIDRAITRWVDAGTGAGVVDLRFRVVRSVLIDAVDNDVRTKSAPTKRIARPTQPEGTKRGQSLSPAAVAALLDAAEQADARWRVFLLVALDAGLRHGEVAALRPCDLDRGEIKVRRSYDRATGKVRDYVKDGEPRRVPVSDRLARALRPYVAAARLRDGEDGLLFTRPSDGGPVTYDVWRKVMPGIRRRAGRRYASASMHDFRHTFITDARNRGVPVDIVGEWVGHASEATTNGYTHGADAALSRAWLRFAAGEGPSPIASVG